MKKMLTFIFCMVSFITNGQSYPPTNQYHTKTDTNNSLIDRIRKIERSISGTTRTANNTPTLCSATPNSQKLDSITSELWKEQYSYTPNGLLIRAAHFEKNSLGEWIGTYKKEYIYNNSGKPVLTTTFVWKNNQWMETEKEERLYDDPGNEIMYLHLIRNKVTLNWINCCKEERAFDNNGHIILTIQYAGDSLSTQWIKKFKYERTYNNEGKMTEEICSHWNNTTGLWVNNTKKEISYYANETTTIIMEWLGQWINSNRETYTFNSNGKITSYALFDWINIQWINGVKYDFTYNDSGREVTNVLYRWHAINYATGELRPISKEESAYDSQGNRIRLVSYNWNSDFSRWDNSIKKEYTFDKKGNKLSASRAFWQQTSWYIEYHTSCSYEDTDPKLIRNEVNMTELTYNNLYRLDEMILPDIYYDYSSQFYDPTHFFETDYIPVRKMVLQYSRHQFDSRNWYLAEKNNYHYSPNITTLADPELASAIIIYHAASKCITVNYPGNRSLLVLSLCDMSGKTIAQYTVDHLTTISVSDLKPGGYMLRLTDKGKLVCQEKVIIE